MKTYSKLKAGVAPAALGLAMIAMPAFAQDATATPQAAAAAADDAAPQQQIIVTGSLIRNPNLISANPINVTTSEEIELKQSNVAEEVLREIPGVVPNIGSSVNNGNGGSSYVDLRGLGSNRNIVLLDGNRIVPVDLAGRVDLNNIPLALISRVDALTGSAVTTYGADAITGVVNFVTKKNFAGVDLSLGEGINERGDGNTARVDLTVGGNFDDGKGNAVLSLGYQKSDAVYQGDRDYSVNQISSFTGGPSGSGTSVPARLSGTRPLIAGTSTPDTTNPNLAQGVRQVNAAGAAVGTFQRFNFNPYNVFQTPFKRYNMFAQANYEISDSIEVYTRGLFSKNTVSTIIAPSGSFGGPLQINLNNPYLPATLRNQLCSFDVNPSKTVYQPRFSQAECDGAALATGPTDARYRLVGAGGFVPFDVNGDGKIGFNEGYNPNPAFTYNRRATEVGPRISSYDTSVFDFRLGLRGSLSPKIHWDLNGSYGQSTKTQTIRNYTLQSKFRQGALVNGTLANPVCQDPTSGCVPLNLFGPEGSLTPASVKFLSANSFTQVKTSLAQARGLVTTELFTLPSAANPVSLAVGAEYRRYTAQQIADLPASTPGELGGAGAATLNFSGQYSVYEGYAELVAPLIEDKPLFKSLTLEGGGRYSSYQVKGAASQNKTGTYKIGLSWEPIADLKFRGNFAHAVRAPNIGELFTPISTGLTNLGIDPCAGAAPTTNANLAAVCIAQGAPVGSIGSIANPTAGQANITTLGEINLKPEKADTYTVGAIFQPQFLRGFSMSVDYYHIKVTNEIGSQLPGDLIAACFSAISSTSASNPACTITRRNPLTGGLDGDTSITPGLFALTTNQGRLFTNGIDLTVNYARRFGPVKWQASFVGNYTAHSKFKASPAAIDRECVGYYSPNCSFTGSLQPKYQWSLRNTLTYGRADLSLLWRHIDSMRYEPQQAADDGQGLFAGIAPAGTGPIAGTTVDFNRIPSANYFDLAARFEVSDNFSMTISVSNLLDKQPPIVGNTAGTTAFNSGNTFPSTYDSLGRRFQVGAHVKF